MPPKRGTEFPEYDCPLGCGAKVKNIPAHIRGECSAANAERERMRRERERSPIPAAYHGGEADAE